MKKWVLGTVFVLAVVAVAYAQGPPRQFMQQIEVHRGDLVLGTSVDIVMEGATVDAFDTTITVEDPTVDRTWTVPDSASDTFVGLAATQTFTNKTLTTPVITSPNITTTVLTAAGGTETLTSADCGQTTLLDTATGSVVTLPAATGTGCTFTFLVTVVLASGTHDIVVVGTDEFIGALTVVSTTIANSDTFSVVAAADNDTIQMDGNTEGGEPGSMLTVIDTAAGEWFVRGELVGVGATPTTAFLTAQVS